MVKQKSATVNLTIEEFTKENLALALYGNHVVGTPGTVTARPGGGRLHPLACTAPESADGVAGCAIQRGQTCNE